MTPFGDPPFDVDHFKSLTEFSGSYKQHNLALKGYREYCRVDGPIYKEIAKLGVSFSNAMLAAVAEVVHDKKGPDFQVDLKKMKHYNWKEMIAQLRDEDIEWVVNGDSNKGGGVERCDFRQRPGSNAHSYHNLQRGRREEPQETDEEEWDFLITRKDGTQFFMHPDHKTRKIRVWTVADGHVPPVAPPRRGWATQRAHALLEGA